MNAAAAASLALAPPDAEYTLREVSIDDVVVGVKTIDKEGHESLVPPYVATPYVIRPIQLADEPKP